MTTDDELLSVAEAAKEHGCGTTFFQAVTPDVVAGLIRRAQAAEKEAASWKGDVSRFHEALQDNAQEIAALRARLAAVEKEVAVTDLPDAVVEAAAEALYRHTFKDMRGWNYADPPENWLRQARAALAAASGPWAANAERDGCDHGSHVGIADTLPMMRKCLTCGFQWTCLHDAPTTANEVLFWRDQKIKMQAERDAALARNAELEREVRCQEELRKTVRVKYRNQRDALRAELDNLRESLAQKIEAEVWTDAEGETTAWRSGKNAGLTDAAAIVRGSDDA